MKITYEHTVGQAEEITEISFRIATPAAGWSFAAAATAKLNGEDVLVETDSSALILIRDVTVPVIPPDVLSFTVQPVGGNVNIGDA